MAYVVTDNCIKCKYTDCVDVCPVDCFVEGPNFLAINPDAGIDCTLCVAECPTEAIDADTDVPEDQVYFILMQQSQGLVPCQGQLHREAGYARSWAYGTIRYTQPSYC